VPRKRAMTRKRAAPRKRATKNKTELVHLVLVNPWHSLPDIRWLVWCSPRRRNLPWLATPDAAVTCLRCMAMQHAYPRAAVSFRRVAKGVLK